MRIVAIAMAAIGILASAPLAAQDASEVDHSRAYWQTQLWDALMKIALPSWVDEQGLFVSKSGARQNRQGAVTTLEFVPRGQSFENWQTLMLVKAERVGDIAAIKPQHILLLETTPIRTFCEPDTFRIVQVGNHPEDVIVSLVVCGKFKDVPLPPGYSAESGSVLLFRITKSKLASLVVSQEWRGIAFDPEDREAWPASRDDLSKMVTRFAGMGTRLIPLPKPVAKPQETAPKQETPKAE